jgi:long-chain acyl-CoA synthetase
MGAGLRAPVAVVVPSASAGQASREDVGASLEATLREVNESLESHERLATIYVVADSWTVENGLLTPTLKIKREKLEARYTELIRQGGAKIVWSRTPATAG